MYMSLRAGQVPFSLQNRCYFLPFTGKWGQVLGKHIVSHAQGENA